MSDFDAVEVVEAHAKLFQPLSATSYRVKGAVVTDLSVILVAGQGSNSDGFGIATVDTATWGKGITWKV